MHPYVLASWALLGLAGTGLAIGIGRSLRLRWLPTLAIAISALVAIGFAVRLAQWVIPARPVDIRIDAPEAGQTIQGVRVQVSGTARPTTARVTVVVRPEGENRWWTQKPAILTTDGSWRVDDFLGEPDDGAAKNYELAAIASADRVWLDLVTGRYTSEGDERATITPWSQSPSVLVWDERTH
jgi:hypothetical protein